MHSRIKILCVTLLGWAWMSGAVLAMEDTSNPRAVAGELPAALRAVHVQPHEVLTVREAARVRGQWIMTLNLPYFATQIQGYQPFTLQLWTLGAGIAPGTPVYVRLSVGY